MSIFFEILGRTANWPIAWRKQTQPYNNVNYTYMSISYLLWILRNQQICLPSITQVDYGLGQKWFLPPSGLNGIRENLASYHSDNESGISLCRAIREGLPPFWNVHVQWMFCEETVLSIRLWSLQLPKTSNGKKVRQFFCCFKDSIENSDILTMQRVFNVALNQRY